MKPKKILRKSPIPKAKVGRPKTTTYPFEALDIEESFVCGKYTGELLQRVASSAQYYGNKLNKRFVLRNDGGLLKVWRAA